MKNSSIIINEIFYLNSLLTIGLFFCEQESKDIDQSDDRNYRKEDNQKNEKGDAKTNEKKNL